MYLSTAKYVEECRWGAGVNCSNARGKLVFGVWHLVFRALRVWHLRKFDQKTC